jgi:hypothetical protein
VLVLADGFSCREQIRQGTGRRALHLAEAVALALSADGMQRGVEARGRQGRWRWAGAVALVAGSALTLVLAARATARRR